MPECAVHECWALQHSGEPPTADDLVIVEAVDREEVRYRWVTSDRGMPIHGRLRRAQFLAEFRRHK